MIEIAPEIREELAQRRPVVALETTLVTHGSAYPANLEIARRMARAIAEEGASAATIGIGGGRARVGLSETDLARLAQDGNARKVSRRDLPLALAQGANGGTTVAATSILAHRAGIGVFATGGIGGVHRGHPEDISADLPTLATTPIVVVCAGAKAILDLPRTLEYLETQGVPVIGYQTGEFPAFYSRHSGLPVDARVDSPGEVAAMVQARAALGLDAALLVCVPCPEEDELPAETVETSIAEAVSEANAKGVSGRDVTPFLLARLVEMTGGQSQRANEALLVNNARVAARIAAAITGLER